MQKMLAAELRQEAGRIAHDNVLVKSRTPQPAESTASSPEHSRHDKEVHYDGPEEKPEQAAQAILLAAESVH